MARFESDNKLIKELQAWQDELFVDDVIDEVIYNTLETVISMIAGD